MANMLDHEKLDVYQVELRFVAWVGVLLRELAAGNERECRHVCDHLDRASLSVLLNTAEGNGKRQRRTRAKFFDHARGSATECSACLDVLTARGVRRPDRVKEGKDLLVRIVSMLTKLVRLFSGATRTHEEEGEYELGSLQETARNLDDEDEDDDEED